MDLEQAQHTLTDLPGWAQLVILAILVVLGTFFGKRKTTAKKSRRPHTLHGAAVTELTPDSFAHIDFTYDPHRDDTPDPGEVVWAWIPYVEQDGRGKDRPVLIVGRVNPTTVAGCYLSTRQHRGYLTLGSGPWDRQGRVSYLNPERVFAIPHEHMRREGAVLDRARFEKLVSELFPPATSV